MSFANGTFDQAAIADKANRAADPIATRPDAPLTIPHEHAPQADRHVEHDQNGMGTRSVPVTDSVATKDCRRAHGVPLTAEQEKDD